MKHVEVGGQKYLFRLSGVDTIDITPISSKEVSLGSYSLATFKDPNFNRRGAHSIVEYTGKLHPPGQYQGPIHQSASLRDSDDEDTAVDYPIEPAFTQDSLASLNATYRRVVYGFGVAVEAHFTNAVGKLFFVSIPSHSQ